MKCKTCEKAIFDPHWGEMKCSAYQRRVYNPDEVLYCDEYKKGEPKETKHETLEDE